MGTEVKKKKKVMRWEKTYCVVLPECCSTLVNARVWHTGQSTGAGAMLSDANGVTV